MWLLAESRFVCSSGPEKVTSSGASPRVGKAKAS
jgi:hypothetical protein